MIDLKHLNKNQVLVGLGIGLIIIAIIAGLFGNGSGLQGNVNDTDTGADTTAEEQKTDEEECSVDPELESLVESLNDAADDLDTVNIEDKEQIDGLKTIASGYFSILKSLDVTPCPEMVEVEFADLDIDDISNLELVEMINGAAEEINKACEGIECGLDEVKSLDIEFGCNADKEYDEDSDSCKVPVSTSCSALSIYLSATAANSVLDNYKAKPSEFSTSARNELLAELLKIDGSYNLSSFDYYDDAAKLSLELVSLVDGIKKLNEPACEQLASISAVEVAERTVAVDSGAEAPDTDINNALNGRISCPANSILDADTQECFCPSTDDYVATNGTCSINVVNTSEEILYCSDGTATFDLQQCSDIRDSIEDDEDEVLNEQDDFLNIDPDEEIVNDFPMNEDDIAGVEPDIEDFADLEDPADDNETPDNSNTTESDVPAASTSNAGSLNSNTNANVMASGIVQGDTGPGVWLALLISSLLITANYKLVNRRR